MNAAERALLRIREEMTERKITQRDLADRFGCSQGRVAKMLNGSINLRVEDLEQLAGHVGIPLSEAVRDRGLEFYAELTPTELRVLNAYQRRSSAVQNALQTLLGLMPAETKSAAPVPKRRSVGRPLDPERVKKGARR